MYADTYNIRVYKHNNQIEHEYKLLFLNVVMVLLRFMIFLFLKMLKDVGLGLFGTGLSNAKK